MTLEQKVSRLAKKVRMLMELPCCPEGLNGLSSDDDFNIVLGQDVAEAGNPAALTSTREIPMEGFSINLVDIVNQGRTFLYGGGILLQQDNVFSSGVDIVTYLSTGLDVTTSNNSNSFNVQITPNIASFAMHDNVNDEHFSYGQANLTITGNSNISQPPSINLTDNNTGVTGTIKVQSNMEFQFTNVTKFAIDPTGKLLLDGSLITTAPSNTSTPAAWKLESVGGVDYKVPLYT